MLYRKSKRDNHNNDTHILIITKISVLFDKKVNG